MGHATPPPPDIPKLIHALESRDRDSAGIVSVPPVAALGKIPFVQVRGLSAFWRADGEPDLLRRMEDLLAALNGVGIPLHCLLIGHQGQVAFYIGLEHPQSAPLLRPLLASVFPGAHLAETATSHMDALLTQTHAVAARGLLTGIPTRGHGHAPPANGQRTDGSRPPTNHSATSRTDQIERVIRGMQGYTWGWWLNARPVLPVDVAVETNNILDLLTRVSKEVKRQFQTVTMLTKEVRPKESEGTTSTYSDEVVNAQAEYAVTLLQRQRDRYTQAKASGLWNVVAQAIADQPVAVERLLALLRAAFSGVESTPESVRTYTAREVAGANPLMTSLTSSELATLVQFPQQEFQGFRVGPYARFDTDPPDPPPAAPFPIGEIIDGERRTGAVYAIDENDLARHALVAGMTGSGKTTTVFNVLLNLRAHNKSFLVIEPAKAEYRDMLGAANPTGKPAGPVPDLRVYTLGDETVAPFRLNPFEFDVIDMRNRVHVQTHIDYLKAVFNAAFILYAPMPYVLETCLHEIYTDAGWDLASGLNSRLGSADYTTTAQWPIFPTLDDLYHKLDEVVDRLGYEERIAMNVKAGLKARVGALMLGSKGLMLNCRNGIPMIDLLRHPTVLELERIGNDDEKAFIIGLIMARLYEFRRLQVGAGGRAQFRHLTVIEEAHRLLKNVSTEVPIEGANTRGQAVETFANMLSEMRSYGQGFLIAEQIPTKLAPDALKNTNLKIVHRLVAADEREIIAGTTNMNEEQTAYLSTLRSGRFVAYAEHADYPYLLAVDDVRQSRFPNPTSDDGVRAAMQVHTQATTFEPVRGYWRHVSAGARSVNPYRFSLAERVLNDRGFAETWAALILHIVRQPEGLEQTHLADLARLVQAAAGSAPPVEVAEVLRAVIVLAVDQTINRRGRLYRWAYTRQSQMHDTLLNGLIALLDGQIVPAQSTLTEFVREYRVATTLTEGPFVGCAPCRVRCWLRPDVAVLAGTPGLRTDAASGLARADTDREGHEELAVLSMSTIRRAVGDVPPEVAVSLTLCLNAHLTAELGLSRAAQADAAQATSLLFQGSPLTN